ncbi:MAG: hypothetical protein OEY99_07890 [Aigarchaeota archaeon]|nr:hypothetical protein [Aigarchaeota archaeon]
MSLPRRSKRALSVPLTTLILSSVLISVAIVALYTSNEMVEIRSQDIEFQQAQGAYVLLASIIEEVAGEPESASYVLVSSRTGGVRWQPSARTLSVEINGGAWNPPLLQNVQLDDLTYYAGERIAAADEYLRGNTSRILNNIRNALVAVHVTQSGGACVVLDTARLLVVNEGSFPYLQSAMTYNTYNVVHLTLVKLALGEARGSGHVRIKARCTDVSTDAQLFPGQNSVTVTLHLGGQQEFVTVSGDPTADGTIVKVDLRTVEISLS